MKFGRAGAALALTLVACAQKPATPALSQEAALEKLLAQMTLEEKLTLVGGIDDAPGEAGVNMGGARMGTRAIPRLGIPGIAMSDGPLGVRNGPNTAFPSGTNMGASFNPALVSEVAAAMGEETLAVGRRMLLGPCVNIARAPLGGRNFESFGEDPFLNSQYAAAYVRGLQGRGVIASVKHFALNEQEYERETIDVRATKRTMHEMHFPAFRAGVEAGALSVMSSFNRVNGEYASENSYLLGATLKKRWGFRGFVISDWSAVHSTVASANAGLDLEMPLPDYFAPEKLKAALAAGRVKEEVITEKARRILRAVFAVGLLGEKSARANFAAGPETPAHRALARKMAEESLVLLKNENSALPLEGKIRSLALVGPGATYLESGGGGSSRVIPASVPAPSEVFRANLPGVEIRSALGGPRPNDREPLADLRPAKYAKERGLRAEYFHNAEFRGKPFRTELSESISVGPDDTAGPGPAVPHPYGIRWSGYVRAPATGRYLITTESHEGNRLWINRQELIRDDHPHRRIPNRAEITLEAGRWYPIRAEFFTRSEKGYFRLGWARPYPERLAEAVAAARGADAAIVFAGLHESLESEGVDRKTLALPWAQAELIRAVSAVNPRTVVVLNGGGAFTTAGWGANARAILHAFYPGQAGSEAIFRVVRGLVNPSGKLPVSFPKRIEDSSSFGNYPGSGGRVTYREGIFVGYRGHDAKKIAPLYPFGFGLSYTQFRFADLRVEKTGAPEAPTFRVTFDVTNTGPRAGAEVAQVYVGARNPRVPRPPRELKGFARVELAPGEKRRISLPLDAASFAYFNEAKDDFVVDPGRYEIEVGSSSRALSLRQTLEIAAPNRVRISE